MWGAMAYRSTPIVVTSGTPGRTPTRAAGRPRFVKSRPGARCTAGCRRAFYSTTRCIVVSVPVYRQRLRPFTRLSRPSTRRGAGTRNRSSVRFPPDIVVDRPRVASRVARVRAWHRFDRLVHLATVYSPATPGRTRSQTPTRPAQRRGARRPSAARPARVSGVIAKCVRG